MGLRPLLAHDQQLSSRVKRGIVQLCVALADHGYVKAEGGEHVIAFLIRNLIPPDEAQLSVSLSFCLSTSDCV
jgi:hypothetical protein